jgi:hypothetical protein
MRQHWPDERVHVVLCHELAHIRRHDWLVQIGAEAVRTVLWFNPLIWIACTRLRRESEQGMRRRGAREGHRGARLCRAPAGPRPAVPPARIPLAVGRTDGSSFNARKENRRTC